MLGLATQLWPGQTPWVAHWGGSGGRKAQMSSYPYVCVCVELWVVLYRISSCAGGQGSLPECQAGPEGRGECGGKRTGQSDWKESVLSDGWQLCGPDRWAEAQAPGGSGYREASVSSREILIFIRDILLGSWCLLGTASGDPGGAGTRAASLSSAMEPLGVFEPCSFVR